MANEKDLSINLRPDVAIGTYANLAIITHSSSEFIIDFASMLPGIPKPDVTNRIIMAPEHAKRLFLALQDNLMKYEGQFGEIELEKTPKTSIPFGGFGQGSQGQGSMS